LLERLIPVNGRGRIIGVEDLRKEASHEVAIKLSLKFIAQQLVEVSLHGVLIVYVAELILGSVAQKLIRGFLTALSD